MASTTSPNMNLQIPTVGSEAGPTYASDINNSLNIVDQHDHTPGRGVTITPSGLNINADLVINNNNLTAIRTTRFQAQSTTLSLSADLDCLYVTGVDLYYRDGSGNNVRITQSGNVAGTPGSISGLVSPASASYDSGTSTFVWQSAALTAANMDAGSFILRNMTASSKGLTLNPPGAMAADYSLTLPALPVSQKIMTLDAAGNITAPYVVDNSTIEVSSNTIRVKDQGITQAKKALRAAPTTPQATAGGFARSSSISYTHAAPLNGPITLATITITTLGNPVVLQLIDDSAFASIVETGLYIDDLMAVSLQFYRGSTQLSNYALSCAQSFATPPSTHPQVSMPGSALSFIDFPAAGTYTYTLQVNDAVLGGNGTFAILGSVLVAYEL